MKATPLPRLSTILSIRSSQLTETGPAECSHVIDHSELIVVYIIRFKKIKPQTTAYIRRLSESNLKRAAYLAISRYIEITVSK